jgi:hypothetical protein
MFIVRMYHLLNVAWASDLVLGSSASFFTQYSPWRIWNFSSLKIPSIARTQGPYEHWRTSSSWWPAPRSMQKLKKMKSAQVSIG